MTFGVVPESLLKRTTVIAVTGLLVSGLCGPAGAGPTDGVADAASHGVCYGEAAFFGKDAIPQCAEELALFTRGVQYDQGDPSSGISQDYARAAAAYRKAAELGFAPAAENLGVLYQKGLGVPQDYALAAYWYRKADGVTSWYDLAQLYANGLGVKQDYAQAAALYLKGADQGDAPSELRLAVLYFQGQGVPQDDRQGVDWCRKSADQGYAQAQSLLGLLYAQGRGVLQDYVQAHMWLNLAASHFDTSETQTRDITIQQRDLITAKMTPDQIAEAQRRAAAWVPALAK